MIPDATAEAEQDPDVPVFSPPSFKCSNFDLRLTLTAGKGGLEGLSAGLWDEERKVAGFIGCYALREEGDDDFMKGTCGTAPSKAAIACAAELFDADGTPKAPLRDMVSSRALSGGILFLEIEQLEDKLAGGDTGLEFASAVARCLSGPLKRVTLTMCVADAAAFPQACWAPFGFRRVDAGSTAWLFVETGAVLSRAGPGRTKDKPKTSPMVQSPLGLPSSPSPRRRTPLKRPRDELVGGKLAARVHYALTMAAEQGADRLRIDANSHFKDGVPGGKFWGSESLPEDMRAAVFKAFVNGMAEVLDTVAALLRDEQLPTVSAVMDILAPFSAPAARRRLGLRRLNRHLVSHFFSKGGRVEHVLHALLEKAAPVYEECDGAAEGGGTNKASEAFQLLPSHMLDGDFDFVRSALIPNGIGKPHQQ